MMTITRPITIVLAISFVLLACNQENEKKAALEEQMRQDSIQQAEQAARIQARADSLAQAMAEAQRLQELEALENETITTTPENNPNGTLEIQAEAWRSETFAQKRLAYWKEQGFEEAFVVRTGDEASGEIWFRIRLLKVSSEQLEATLASLKSNYNSSFWVTKD